MRVGWFRRIIGAKGSPAGNGSVEVEATAPAVAVPVLMYHNIWDGECAPDCPDWVTSTAFRQQMEAIKANGYATITPYDLLGYITGRLADLPSKPCMITFDDGYESIYTVAFPLLRELGLKATFFIPTAFITGAAADRKMNLWDTGKRPVARMAIWPELREMLEAGFQVESHSRDHINLTEASDTEARKQISESYDAIREGVGQAPAFLCYPFGKGAKDERIRALVREHGGYVGAFSAWPPLVENTSTTDVWAIKRMEVCRRHSVEYDPQRPRGFFMRQLDPGFPAPRAAGKAR